MAGTRNYDFLVRRFFAMSEVSSEQRFELTLPTLTDKTPAHRRLGRRKILLPAALQRGFFHTVFHHHYWNRLQDSNNRA